jgi:hypothetical protein
LTKAKLNVFKGSIYKKIVMKDLFKKNDGVWQQKKVPWRPWSFDMKNNCQSNLWRMFVLSFLLCISVQK